MPKETVFIAKNENSPQELGFEIVKMMGLDFRNKRVLIKPNLTIKASADSGIVTNPVFCKGIIDYFKNSGVLEIKIGEGTSAAENDEMEGIFQTAGYLDLSSKTNIELINFNRDEIVELEVQNPIVWKTVKVAKSILDFDVLVNVPVLKTHHIALVTLGIKNLMGLFMPVSERDQAFYQELSFLRKNAKKERRQGLNEKEFKQAHVEISEKIIDLYKAVREKIQIITIVDGFFGREGDGFERGKTKNMGIAIAGENAVAVDTVGAYIMGFNSKNIYYLNLAQKQKLGPSQISKIEIKGINPKSIRESFKVIKS